MQLKYSVLQYHIRHITLMRVLLSSLNVVWLV